MNSIDTFIYDAHELLGHALETNDQELKWAILKNIELVIGSYVKALEEAA